jgi:type II secretory pathway pseudopilin PulG
MCPRARALGFTYIGILLAVAFIGTGLAVVGQLWSVTARRADEQELLYVGDSFRRAIASYYRAGPARQYPQSLDELLLDTRGPVPLRHLRKMYLDPITRQRDWEVVTLADGAIIGVASPSQGTPLKRANFEPQDAAFEGAECYCDWQFLFLPQRSPLQRAPIVRPTTP